MEWGGIMKNPVLENIYTRRSVRSYKYKKVPKKLIEELLNAAVMAPSARNKQPWHFTIVEGEKVNHYGELVIKEWKVLGLAIKLGIKLTKVDMIFYNAPLLIFISGPASWKYLKDDVNLAAQNMMLAAHSLGLGSCWIGFAKVLDKNEQARKELGIPDDFKIVAPLIFGYPDKEVKNIPQRKPKILKWITS